MSIFHFLVAIFCVMSLFIGIVHVGFALTEDAPRSIWDWYVFLMGLGTFVLYFPVTKWMAS